MYDIQNALRRRALAERLEALKHAADEAAQAAAAVPDPQGRPRHLAPDEQGVDPGPEGYGGVTPLADDLSLPQPVPQPVPQPAPQVIEVGTPDQNATLEMRMLRLDPPGPPPLRTEPPVTPPPSPRPEVRAPEPPAVETATEQDLDDSSEVDNASPAAAIADLMRQGGASLFFNRNPA